MIDADAQQLAIRCRDDFEFFAKHCLKIRTKSGRLEPFRLNRGQRHLHDKLEAQLKKRGKVRAVILKGRQMGISTYLQGRFYWKLWRSKRDVSLTAYILTHEQAATDNLFGMAQRFHDEMPAALKPPTKAANAKELRFADNGCGYQVATAGGREVGRSTTIQLFHGCLAPTTPIVDPISGKLRTMEAFILGDRVRTHTGALASISAISRQTKPAFRLKLKGLQWFPLDATGEHRFWTPTGWREVADLAPGDKIGYPVAPISDAGVVWRYRVDRSPRPQGGGLREVGPDTIAPSYGLGRLVGLYLAEGSTEATRVTFSVHEREVTRTMEWLKPFAHLYRGAKVSRNAGTKTVHVRVSGRSFATFMRDRCGELEAKSFPREWRQCGEAFVRGMVHGYLSGDGHSSNGFGDRRIRATSIRSAITVGLRDALASLGYGWASIEYKAAAIRHGRNEREAWILGLCGTGVDRLADELDWHMPVRQRHGNYGSTVIDEGYAWIPIVSKEAIGNIEVMDFEVDHDDHSYCTIHGATHNSEVPQWPNAEDHITSILSTALSEEPGTEAILEATAKGVGNVFHRYCMAAVRGQSDYESIFIPWFWDDGYRTDCPSTFKPSEDWLGYGQTNGLEWDQLYWAYLKNRGLAQAHGEDADRPCPSFKQEFPANFDEAFQSSGASFIPAIAVLRARRPEEPIIGRGPIILGVDPSRSVDKVGIIDRCGRRMGERICERMDPEGDTMFVAAKVARIIDRIKPDAVNIDVGGLGAGVYDRLMEMGYGYCLNAVNFGSRPIGRGPTGEEMYANRRAEMHDLMRDWFEGELPVQIPDDDGLHADLTAPEWGASGCRYNTGNELIMEDKAKIKARLGASPDLSDSAALTFAVPFALGMVAQNQTSAPKRRSKRTGY